MDLLKNQLQTGKFEKPTITSVLKDSGALSIDVTFGECKQADDDVMETDSEICLDFKHGDTRCHQETQTDLFSFSKDQKPNEMVHEGCL